MDDLGDHGVALKIGNLHINDQSSATKKRENADVCSNYIYMHIYIYEFTNTYMPQHDGFQK